MDAEQDNSSKKRGLTWSDQETKALLSTWGEGKIQSELDNSTRNTHVFSSIIRTMGGLGYLRTAPECRQRIKTLKRNYFNAKNSNKLSGNGRTTCRYYDELEDILGGRPAVTPPKVRDTSENHSSRKNSVECSEPEDEDGDMDSIFQQPSTSSSSACSVTVVPATVKLIADSQIEKDTSLPQMTHISRAERKMKKKEKKTRMTLNVEKKQGTSGKIRKSDESLMAMLKEQQNEFLSNESKRWEEEKAREEKMRKEDKEHELKLFSMFATILKGQPSSQITSCHASSVSSFPSSSFQDSTFQASPLHSTSTSSTYHIPTSNVNNASFLSEASCSNMSFLRMLNNDDCF
ncbi:unnamed protein product [Mytilus coruscus]|uniref:Myb/SANT-like DNA-binding domain-containing protein n=1 Tax=Mytilus coruscus TaxID=42192 RepID=A0A6J8AI83_MYTCO|nr:unnamed protein product [Mytilus coruscus]